MASRSNQDWIIGLKQTNNEAWVKALSDFLSRGLLSYFGNNSSIPPEELEDLTQESVVKILGKLDSFRGESKFTTWAMKIGVNLTISELRRKRWKEVSLDEILEQSGNLQFADVGTSPEKNVEDDSARAEVLHAVDTIIQSRLTERQKTAFLAMLGGMPLAEIARRTKITRNAVYKIIHDARVKIKADLNRMGWTNRTIQDLL
jgi:RNA polymerase sigma-70 factor (ECF subfamily)